MITLNNITNKPCSLYAPDGTLVGEITNELVLNDARIQIAEKHLEGYYIIFEGQRLEIDTKGMIDRWPKGFFDILDNQLCQLLKGKW